jgi:hypothetical protein
MLAGLLAVVAIGARAEDRLVVQVPALLDSSAPIAESVRRDCKIDEMVGRHVYDKVSEKYPGTGQLVDPLKAGPDRVLKLTIVGVLGVGGGAWSGSKAITVRAELEQNSKVYASKLLTRQSGGGAFGGFKGTCSIMERIARALGGDVAAWVPGALSAVPTSAAPAPEKPAGETKQ